VDAFKWSANASGLGNDELFIERLRHCNEFMNVGFLETAGQSVVRVMTRLFSDGHITVLVGTTSLLGEGWDAPAINTLVLASGVGSFMLSNQMRGRAIRIDPDNKAKAANIWHLVTVEPDWHPGGDYETLERRFRAFVGVARNERIIESGIQRLKLGAPPFSRERIKQINRTMEEAARNRAALRTAWSDSLVAGSRLMEAVETPKQALPRRMVFANTLAALCWQGAMLGLYFSQQILGLLGRSPSSDYFWLILKVAAAVGALVSAPFFLKAGWLFIRHGTVERSLQQVGTALMDALLRAGVIQSPREGLAVHAAQLEEGGVRCWLNGGSSFEQSLFLKSLREILDPVENPRYVLVRRSRLFGIGRKDYHAVPELLGRKKENALYFLRAWKKRIGPAELVYTRTVEGRRLLLHSRARSLAASFQPRSQRRSCWR
jgi:hypothetical protein